MENKIIRESLRFKGMVQGVGFRYRALHAAEQVGVTGWVKNNFDDSVLMEIQGTKEQIERVLMLIRQGKYIYIDDIEAKVIPVEDDERYFRIR